MTCTDPNATHYEGCECHEQGWRNKWETAVEIAAQAQTELAILKGLASDLVDHWESDRWMQAETMAKHVNEIKIAISRNPVADAP